MSTEQSETRLRILAATWDLMLSKRGVGVRMQDIATAAKVSRQAVYLHFASRAELLVATTQYGDEINGLEERLIPWQTATSGIDKVRTFVEFWGNYVPCIYGIAKPLMDTRETDEAAAAAWNDRMAAIRRGCGICIDTLDHDGQLSGEWTRDEAVDMFWTLLSIRTWEHLTIDCGWSTERYIARIQMLALNSFVVGVG